MNSNIANGGRPVDFCRFTCAPTMDGRMDSANAPDLHKLINQSISAKQKGSRKEASDGAGPPRGAERSTLSAGGGARARMVSVREAGALGRIHPGR